MVENFGDRKLWQKVLAINWLTIFWWVPKTLSACKNNFLLSQPMEALSC